MTPSQWGGSAINKLRANAPPPPPKPYEEEFPTLGGAVKKTIPKVSSSDSMASGTSCASGVSAMSKSSSGLSMAERLKKQLEEEEAERQRQAYMNEEDRKRREDEEYKNNIGVVYIPRRTYTTFDKDGEQYQEDGYEYGLHADVHADDDLEHDVYGRSSGAARYEYDEQEDAAHTPEYSYEDDY
jgi:hypothetical protein